MNPGRTAISLLVATLASISPGIGLTQSAAKSAVPSKVIIDTDIGDDIDDVFAISIALTSPELKILGISSAWGDTVLRTRMLDRLLCETGREDIPVRTGIPTKAPATAFSQRPWASKGILRSHGDAVDFLLEQIQMNPGEITLIVLAPPTNIGAAIERDPVTPRRLKRVVLMGGSVYRGYGDLRLHHPAHGPSAGVQHCDGPCSVEETLHLRRAYLHDAARLDTVEVRRGEALTAPLSVRPSRTRCGS